jgi:hypothetical protein
MDKFYFIIDDDIDYFFDILQEFTKKMKLSHLKKCEKKLCVEELSLKLNETPDKFVSWLLT